MTVTARRVLVAIAVIIFVVAVIVGFGGWDSQADHEGGWLALGLVFFAASTFP